MEIIIGLVFVTLAGFGTGASAWPMKVIKDFHFEQYLFFSMLLAIVIYPWLFVLINVPDPVLVIKTVGFKPLLVSNLLTIAWGVANVLYMICVLRIGAALTGAILSAMAMSVGVIMPLILKGSGLFNNAPDLLSKPGFLIMTGLIVIIIGVALVSKAGFGREKVLNSENGQTKKEQASGNFLQGLLLAILAGILSSGLGLAFVYGQGPIIEAVKQQGVGEIVSNVTVWALVCVGGALVNILYAAFWMTKKKSWKLLFTRKDELMYGAVLGAQFIIAVILMGRGMVLLGILGASVGYGIQQSMQVVGNQVVGFFSGEWKLVKGKPRVTMYIALVVILIAVIILAYSNTTV
jgi:L-rhamnose-H+ transport protein